MQRSKILIYSFRTNRHLEKFSGVGLDVFIFGKLKDDLERFKEIIKIQKPSLIFGVAEVSSQSRFEVVAVNQFGPKGRVSKGGKEQYALHVQVSSKANFPKASKPTTTFCNWTAYKISEEIHGTNTKLSFLHFNRKDIESIIDFLKEDQIK